MKTMLNDTTLKVDRLDEITPDDVAWLKSGSHIKGRYIENPNSVIYTTSRGVSKQAKCFVCSNGNVKWHTFSNRQRYDSLSDEEAKWLDPDTYARRMGRKEKWRDEREKAKQEIPPVKVGDIFAGSFGYDATLWDFFEVVDVSSTGKTVTVRELKHETQSGYGYNDWKCRPVPSSYVGKPIKKKVQVTMYGGETVPYLKISSYEYAYLCADPTEWHDADNYH